MGGPYTKKQNLILYGFVLLSAPAIYLFYILTLPELHFFGDPLLKWTQIQDLIAHNYQSIACVYPSRDLDPEMRFFPLASWSIKEGACYYWFPYILSYVFAPAYELLGNYGIPVLQHLFSISILMCMISFAKRLRMSFSITLAALVLFRFGTANFMNVHDLEDHTISVAFFCVGLVLILRGGNTVFPGGFLSALPLGVRPEVGLMGLFLFLGYLVYKKQVLFTPQAGKQGTFRIITNFREPLLLVLGFFLGITLIFLLNYNFTGHALGMRMSDPGLTRSYSPAFRLKGMLGYLFISWPFIFQGLLFQMPLLLLAPFNLKIKENKGLTGFFLALGLALIPLSLIRPEAMPTAGFRFAGLLYPVLILLALNPIDKKYFTLNKTKKIVFSLLYLQSPLMLAFSLTYGVLIYKNFLQIHSQIRNINTEHVIIRDHIVWAATAELFYTKKILKAMSDEDFTEVLKCLKDKNVMRVTVIKARLEKRKILKPEHESMVIRKQDSEQLLIRELELKRKK